MRRIDTSTAVADLFGPGKSGFGDGNPALAILATRLNAAFFNSLQEEVSNAVELAGLALDSADNTQLYEAIRLISSGLVTSLSADTVLTAAQCGLLLLDAGGGNRAFTLPASTSGLGVIEMCLRRTDATANVLTIAAAGTDKIMLDTTAVALGQASTELLFSGDFLRLRSDGAGKWWCVGQAQLPGSIATGFVPYLSASSFSYSVPAVLRSGRRLAKVIVTGAGGGGARWSSTAGPSGGGGGGVAEKRINLAGVSAVTITVGAGGAGAASDGFPGGNGGASSFGAYCSGNGGQGGIVGATAVFGSIGVGGDINYTMGTSSPSVSAPGGGTFGGQGGGGVSGFGSVDASTPNRPGCGGGGRIGGPAPSGAAGSVVISW